MPNWGEEVADLDWLVAVGDRCSGELLTGHLQLFPWQPGTYLLGGLPFGGGVFVPSPPPTKPPPSLSFSLLMVMWSLIKNCHLSFSLTFLLPPSSFSTGAGESGKSTVVKQMKILHKDGFSDE